jgi:tetratricopeptide (TPR) repeat protein
MSRLNNRQIPPTIVGRDACCLGIAPLAMTTGTARYPETTRGIAPYNSRNLRANLLAVVALATQLAVGCAPALRESARQVFDRTVRECHLPSAEASGAQREKLLVEAASGYEQVLKLGPSDLHLCAAALRSLANVRVEQGRLSEAVNLYTRVGEKYPTCDWEVLQAWKSAGDLLWDAGRQGEAAGFYKKIVQRFGSDPSAIVQIVARAASRRVSPDKTC